MKIINAFVSSLMLLSLGVVGSTKVQAQPEVEGFKLTPVPITLAGNGCPPGTAQAILNGDTLSITFSQFEAKAAPPTVVSKSCNLRIGLDVPSGYNVQPINVAYNGFADVPQGGSSNLNVKLLFQGKTVAQDSSDFTPEFSSTWEKNVPITLATINACAKPVNSTFGINTTLTSRAKSVSQGQETQLRVDTIDTTVGPVLYQIKFAFNPC